MTSFKELSESADNPFLMEFIKEKQEVEMITLDGFVTDNNVTAIDLLKIDTEGFEMEILNGAIHCLKLA